MANRELTQRITDYLTGGGLFNPEMANHEKVRDLLIDCRDALAQPEQERNFCQRCGKRLVDGHIHTCTPPAQVALNKKAENARDLGLDYEPEQELVAHLWECIGRWSSYLAVNGTQANMAPPNWLLDAVKAATLQPRKEWVGLTDDDIALVLINSGYTAENFACAIEAKLKEKNT